jgi:hypothetical protein
MALGGIPTEQTAVYQPVSSLLSRGQEPDGGSSAPAAGPVSAPESQPNPPATINLSSNPIESRPEARRENGEGQKPKPVADTVDLSPRRLEAKQDAPRAEAAKAAARREVPPAKMGDILFVYNFRGDLRIRFMDSSNRLVYQTPPLMLSRMMDLMGRDALRVSMKV